MRYYLVTLKKEDDLFQAYIPTDAGIKVGDIVEGNKVVAISATSVTEACAMSEKGASFAEVEVERTPNENN